MNEKFFQYWFKGFEKSLASMDSDNRKLLLHNCGNECSNSFSKRIYMNGKHLSDDIAQFLEYLKNHFREIDFQLIDDKTIILNYTFCACDFVKMELIKSPLFCECSRQSLLSNWESVYGEGVIKVDLLQSILDGSPTCKFKISIVS